MRFIILFILCSSFSMLSAQTYCAGNQVSLTHQDAEHVVCAGFGDYATNDIFKLSDWNGATNGGHYNVIFIDMSASW